MSIAPGVRRYQLYLKMKDKKLLPMNRQLIPLQSSCVRKCRRRRQHHPLPHRQHLLRHPHRRQRPLLHRQNRQKPEVLPVFPTESRPSGSQAGNQNTAEEPKPTPKPTPKVTPTPRPQVIEATPEPTLAPGGGKISRLIHTASIFCPETAGASTLPQHLVIFTAWVRSGCAATPLLSLYQVPILPASPSRP